MPRAQRWHKGTTTQPTENRSCRTLFRTDQHRPNVVNSTMRSGSMEGAVGGEEVDVSETGSVGSLRSGDRLIAITNARNVNISMSHTMLDVVGSSATEAPEPGTGNRFAPSYDRRGQRTFQQRPGLPVLPCRSRVD